MLNQSFNESDRINQSHFLEVSELDNEESYIEKSEIISQSSDKNFELIAYEKFIEPLIVQLTLRDSKNK